MLNEELADARGLSEATRDKIRECHAILDGLYKMAETGCGGVGPKWVASAVDFYDERLQVLWGFDVDRRKQRYWFNIPGCTCPKLDNEEGMMVIDSTCPFHGTAHSYVEMVDTTSVHFDEQVNPSWLISYISTSLKSVLQTTLRFIMSISR